MEKFRENCKKLNLLNLTLCVYNIIVSCLYLYFKEKVPHNGIIIFGNSLYGEEKKNTESGPYLNTVKLPS